MLKLPNDVTERTGSPIAWRARPPEFRNNVLQWSAGPGCVEMDGLRAQNPQLFDEELFEAITAHGGWPDDLVLVWKLHDLMVKHDADAAGIKLRALDGLLRRGLLEHVPAEWGGWYSSSQCSCQMGEEVDWFDPPRDGLTCPGVPGDDIPPELLWVASVALDAGVAYEVRPDDIPKEEDPATRVEARAIRLAVLTRLVRVNLVRDIPTEWADLSDEDWVKQPARQWIAEVARITGCHIG